MFQQQLACVQQQIQTQIANQQTSMAQEIQLELTRQFQSHNVPGNIPICPESPGMDPKCPQPDTFEIGNPRQSVQFNQQGFPPWGWPMATWHKWSAETLRT